MRGFRLYLIGGSLLLLFYLLALYHRPAETNWSPTYLKEDKIPFGLYILNKEMPHILPGSKIQISRTAVYNTLHKQSYSNTTYLLVCSKLELDKLDYRELMSFMQRGNQVFMATYDPGRQLTRRLKLQIKSTFQLVDTLSAPINLSNPALMRKDGYRFDKSLGSYYFSKLDTARATVLGTNSEGKANFIKYSFGKGALYLLPNPQLLSNYNLLKPEGADYAAKALSYLPRGQRLIWDEKFSRRSTENSSLLRVFFEHERLRWAYFLALTGLLVFILFEMKRRQRIIPVIPSLKNASLDFVKVVGKVYYQQRDNKDIAQKKISYFMDFLRSNYRLNTNMAVPELMEAVRQKSGARQGTLQNLFASIKMAELTSQLSDKELIDLNEYMEEFYKQAQ